MELKVWVDGVQRVICGITDQTTVQEVVIALAQATGRTGRYTLVEKRRTVEKLLPPSVYPLQVLAQSGEQSNEVQFMLRRTGGSSVSDIEEQSAPPERTTYRKSLPPQLKHKQKKEAIMNRKEAKRKSLTITSGGSIESTSDKNSTIVAGERTNKRGIHPSTNDNKTHRSPKKALMPPTYRNQAVNPQRASVSSQSDTSQNITRDQTATPPVYRHIPTPIPTTSKKKALIPPHLKNDYVLKTPPQPLQTAMTPSERGQYLPHERRIDHGSNIPLPQQRIYETPLDKSAVYSKSSDAARARMEFTRLVLQQHEHVNEQSLTLNSLDKELEIYQVQLQSQESEAAHVKKEIDTLQHRISANEVDSYDEDPMRSIFQEENNKGNKLQSEITKKQSEISSVNENLKDLQKRIIFLQKEIEREADYQSQRRKEIAKNRYEAIDTNVRKANDVNHKTISELERIENLICRTEAAIYEKHVVLESLNRELRQVNLQQFIRQTGTKVTVLSHKDDRDATDQNNVTSSLDYDRMEQRNRLPSSGSESGSVWV